MSTTRRLSIKEDAEAAVGATGAVVAADEIIKSFDSEDDQLNLVSASRHPIYTPLHRNAYHNEMA